MKRKLSPNLLGVLLAMTAGHSIAKGNDIRDVIEAADAALPEKKLSPEVVELVDAGYLAIDPVTGKIVVTKDLFQILKESEILIEKRHSERDSDDTSQTVGGGCIAKSGFKNFK